MCEVGSNFVDKSFGCRSLLSRKDKYLCRYFYMGIIGSGLFTIKVCVISMQMVFWFDVRIKMTSITVNTASAAHNDKAVNQLCFFLQI